MAVALASIPPLSASLADTLQIKLFSRHCIALGLKLTLLQSKHNELAVYTLWFLENSAAMKVNIFPAFISEKKIMLSQIKTEAHRQPSCMELEMTAEIGGLAFHRSSVF